MHRRWLIVAIVALILVTLMHLWIVVVWLLMMYGAISLLMWFIDWVTGDDLDNKSNQSNDDEPSEEEKTMWDIYTTHEMMDHHDDWNDHHDDWDDHH